MALEKRDATQVVTFSPAAPKYAWPVNYGGTTNAQQTWAGAGQAGTLYGYVQVNTSAWALQPGGNQPALQAGDNFQLYTTTGGGTFPHLSSLSSGAPDLFDISDLIANNGTFSSVQVKEATVFTVAGVITNTSGTTSTIYFTPVPSSGTPATTDGVVSLPNPGDPRWLGEVGHVTQLTYSWTYPGGPDQLSCLLAVPPNFRTSATNPGRIVQAFRGGSCIWEGILAEPVPTSTGWNITANGTAQIGANYTALFNTWTADDPVNRAIARGLRWRNPGIGKPNGIYLGPTQDSGALNINDFMNLLCTGGGLVWNVTPPVFSSLPCGPWILNVSPLPVAVNGTITRAPSLILASNSPVTRTVNSLINTLVIRYQATADKAATSTKGAQSATYSTVVVDVPQLVQKYGRIEFYLDMSTAGQSSTSNTGTNIASPAPISQAQAIGIGNNILSKYIRANWGGTFTVNPGMLMNIGGVPVDIGANFVGQVCKLAVTDAPYGGEVNMAPIEFLIGNYSYDEDTVTGTVTPYAATGNDISSLISMLYPGLY